MATVSLVRIGLLLIAGLLLFITNYWYVRSVWTVFWPSDDPKVIAPLQIIGKDDTGGKIGQVLAYMLSARLGRIQREMDTTASAFDPARQINTTDRIRPQQLEAHPILVGYSGTSRPVTDVKMSVGGVDLTGLLAWVQRLWTEDNSLQLSVCYNDSTAVITGDLGGPDGSIWVEGSTKNDELIEGVAYELAYRRFVKHVPEINALTPVEFQTMLETLYKASQLNKYFLSGRVPDKDQYVPLLNDIETITRKTTRWRVLVHVTAGLAENARNINKALEWYNVEAELVKADKKIPKSYADSLATRIVALTQEQNATRTVVATGQSATATEHESLSTVSALSAEGKAAVEQIRQLLHVRSLVMPDNHALRIAVLGGLPSDELIRSGKVKVLSTAKNRPVSQDASNSAEGYMTSIVQAAQTVAPDVEFVFSGTFPDRTSSSYGDVLNDIEILAKSHPDVLLITMGPLTGEGIKRVLETVISSNILVVTPIGNGGPEAPIPFAGQPILKQMVVVAATDATGRAAAFSQTDPLCLWAPGVQIPFFINGKTVFQSGTGYSAALIAGIAARVLAEKKLPTPELIDLLRSTAKPVNGTRGPRVVNLEAALEKAKTL